MTSSPGYHTGISVTTGLISYSSAPVGSLSLPSTPGSRPLPITRLENGELLFHSLLCTLSLVLVKALFVCKWQKPGSTGFILFYFLTFLFYIGVELINNVVLISGVQQSDSVIHIHVAILFQILFPFRLLHNTEQSSLCNAVGPCWLSILNIAVCTCQSQTP